MAIRIEEGTPTTCAWADRDAGHVVRALPPHRPRGDHHARSADPPRREPPERPRHQAPRERALCDTLGRDRRRSVAPGRAREPAPQRGRSRPAQRRPVARPVERPIRGERSIPERSSRATLFVALPGERTDGHRFLSDAVAGAPRHSSSRAARPRCARRPSSALRTRWRRSTRSRQAGAPASIRSSSASPGASPRRRPRAIATVLGRFRTLKNEGNQNNEVGLPLTVLKLGPEHEAAVLEMGMYVGGEIADLARIGRPSIGVVTASRPSTCRGSGRCARSSEGRAAGGASTSGTAVLNADDPIVRGCTSGRWPAARPTALPRTPTSAPWTSSRPGSRACASRSWRRRAPAVTIPTLGRLAVHNALAAAAVGIAAGLDLDTIAEGLARGWSAHRGRLVRAGGVTIVDDSYNASPGSVTAALELLAGLPGRRVAVLGEMLELGDAHVAGHLEVGRARPAWRTCWWSSATRHWRSRTAPGTPGSIRRRSSCSRPRNGARHAAPAAPRGRRAGQGVAGDRPGPPRRRPAGRARRSPGPVIELIQGPAPRVRVHGHPDGAVHPLLREPASASRSARRTRDPLRQGRHADDGRHPAHRGRRRDLPLPAAARRRRPSPRWRPSCSSADSAPSTTT